MLLHLNLLAIPLPSLPPVWVRSCQSMWKLLTSATAEAVGAQLGGGVTDTAYTQHLLVTHLYPHINFSINNFDDNRNNQYATVLQVQIIEIPHFMSDAQV